MSPTDFEASREGRLTRDRMYDAAVDLIGKGYQLTLLFGTAPDGTCDCQRGVQCSSPGKHPQARKWTEHPVRTPEALASNWLPAKGTPNLGVMPDDTFVVIDVDRKNGKRGAEMLAGLQREYGSLGDPDQITPSSGLHFVFRLPAGTDPASIPNRSGVVEGIDVLRRGRQFVAAPSQIGMRRYQGSLPRVEEIRELPAPWLAHLQSLGGDAAAERGPVDPTVEQIRLKALEAPSIEKVQGVVGYVPNFPDTTREQYVWMAHAIKGAAGREAEAEGLEIFLTWAGRWDGRVDPSEDERVFTTINWANVRTGWPVLWKVAEKYGYDAEAERTAEAQAVFASAPPLEEGALGAAGRSDSAQRSLHDELFSMRARLAPIEDPLRLENTRVEEIAQIAHHFRVPFSIVRERFDAFDAPHRQRRPQIVLPGPALRDALATDPPQSLVPRYVFKEQQHVLYGAPQSFKTFVALDLALHVATGLPWLGRIPVRQAGVVFFAGEAASGLRVRVAAWLAARGISVEESERIPFGLVDAVPTLGVGEDGLENALGLVREAATGFVVPAGLLVLDNMTRMAGVAGLSTTDPGEYGRILAGIDSLGREANVATLTIYHSPVSDPKRPAGTYQSTANPDVIIKAERPEGALTSLLRVAPPHGKSRSAKPPADVLVRFKVQDVRAWLGASYDRAMLPYPATLTDANGGGFAAVDQPSRNEADAPLQVRLHDGQRVSIEALQQQFTSLVVDGGDNEPRTAFTLGSGPGSDPGNKRQVLESLGNNPGASQHHIRSSVGGKVTRVDRAVFQLIKDGLVEDKGDSRGHQYHLTHSGRAEFEKNRAQDEAAITRLEQATAHPSGGGA